MKFSPTTLWQQIAAAPSKQLQWRFFVRVVNTFATALGAGGSGWTEVTNYVDIGNLPDNQAKMEYLINQFTADNLSFTGMGCAYWQAIKAGVGAGYYLEFKSEATLSTGALVASDWCCTFAGWIPLDVNSFTFDDAGDRVAITARTIEDIGQTIPAEQLTTQYLNTQLDAYGSALIPVPYTGNTLFNIPGLFIVECAVGNGGSAAAIVTVNAAGTGYSVGDVLLLTTGGVLGLVKVLSITGGGSTGPVGFVELLQGGSGYAVGSSATSDTGPGYGTGCTISILSLQDYTLQRGEYQIAYQVVAGVPQVKLITPNAQGAWRVISNTLGQGTMKYGADHYAIITIGDGSAADGSLDTVKVWLVCPVFAALPVSATEVDETFVVVSAGSHLPNQWPVCPTAKTMMTAALNALGIVSASIEYDVTYPDYTIPCIATSGLLANYNVSFTDGPPQNNSYAGANPTICADLNDNLYIAVGQTIYVRDKSTGAYTQLVDFTSAPLALGNATNVARMWYSYSNTGSGDDHEHLWLYLIDNSGHHSLQCFQTSSSLNGSNASHITNTINLRANGTAYPQAAELFFDHAHSLAETFLWSVSGTASNGGIWGVTISGNTLTAAQVKTNTALGYSSNGINARYAYQRESSGFSGYFDTFAAVAYTGSAYQYAVLQFVSGTWTIESTEAMPGAYGASSGTIIWAAAYMPAAGGWGAQILFWNQTSGNIETHAVDSTVTTIVAQMQSKAIVNHIVADPAVGLWYFTAGPGNGSYTGTYYVAAPNPNGYCLAIPGSTTYNNFAAICVTAYAGSTTFRAYGIDPRGCLFMYGTRMNRWLGNADFSTYSIADVLNNVASAFNLIYTINSVKGARVRGRSNDDGTPNIGDPANSYVPGVNGYVNLHLEPTTYPAFQLVSVDNGGTPVTYGPDGLNTNDFNARRIDQRSDQMLPVGLLPHLAESIWLFDSTSHDLYTFETALDFVAEYEILDYVPGGTVLTGRNLTLTVPASGALITQLKTQKNGNLIITVMV